MKRSAPLALLALALSASAAAQVGPAELPAVDRANAHEPGPAFPPPPRYIDQRLRDIVYDPNEVVKLTVAPSRQMTVMFAGGERIMSVAVGDSGSWQVTASRAGDSLFVKPLSTYSETNMTVITDARVYLFDLSPGGAADTVYLVRYSYRDQAPPPAADGAPATAMGAPGQYKFGGDKVVRPDSVRDDGSKTYISWSEGKAMPAVFATTPSGDEMLVDGYVRDGSYTIDRIYQRLIFRSDKKIATATRK